MSKKLIRLLVLTYFVFSLQVYAEDNTGMTSKLYDSMLNDNVPSISGLNLFFTKMPKGGDLHHHYMGTIYAETYLDWVKQQDYRINSCDFAVVKRDFKGLTRGCKLLTVAQLEKQPAFYREVLMKWSVKDFSNHFHMQLTPDLSFFNTFLKFTSVALEQIKLGFEVLKKRALQENVTYIETMIDNLFYSVDYFSEQERVNFNNLLKNSKSQREVNAVLKKITGVALKNTKFNMEIDKMVNMLEKNHQGIDDENYLMRYQLVAYRNLEPLDVFIQLFTSYLISQKSPIVVGVNIVGAENYTIALEDYTLHMQMYNYLSDKYPTVNKALHAGELVLGMVAPKDLTFHIEQAINIAKAQRIGHGIDLSYEQDSLSVLDTMKKNNVPVEINLTSNEFILGIKSQEHPYLLYSSYGVPVVISTDDSGVLRNNLTHEYVLLASRYKPSYSTIKQYVYNSIEYSFLQPEEKMLLKNKLDKKFVDFEAEMANLYDKMHY
ncbi:MAG: adenosine deaminase [Rickettsiaceae bacterium H1]|nr:adenosine deaminase [Rickettsiaceae bacterium H1]